MDILVNLVKLGALGASLAFLYLSYQLLQNESSLKDASNNPVPPRPAMLSAISKFRMSALVFLIVGVIAEIAVASAPSLLQHFLKSDLVRVRFSEWQFFPENKRIAFSFFENRLNTGLFILESEQKRFDVYIAARKKDGTPVNQGHYSVVAGPYEMSSQPLVEKILSAAEAEAIGNDCIEFAAFGLEKVSGKPAKVTAPFDPNNAPSRTVVFNTANACIGKR
jgi:hypothetical protein